MKSLDLRLVETLVVQDSLRRTYVGEASVLRRRPNDLQTELWIPRAPQADGTPSPFSPNPERNQA